MLKHALSQHAWQLIKMEEVKRIDNKSCHLSVFLMRDLAHAIDQGKREELKKVQLERSRSPAVSKVENGKVFVVVVLE